MAIGEMRDASHPLSPVTTYIDFIVAKRWFGVNSYETDLERLSGVMDGTRLIEALVLSDNPVIAAPRPYGTLLRKDPLLGPFAAAGVLDIQSSDRHTSAIASMAEGDAIVREIAERIMMVLVTLNITIENGQRYVPSMFEGWTLIEELLMRWAPGPGGARLDSEKVRPVLERMRALRDAAQAIDTFGASYDALVRATTADLELLKSRGRPIPIVLPPVAAVVLSEARSYDDLGTVALSLRDDLAEARRAFAEHERTIVSDELPIGESVDAARSLQAALDKLLTTEPTRELVAISEWKDLVGLGKSVSEGMTKAGLFGAAGALLGKPLQALDEARQRHQVQYMAVIRDRFRRITQYSKLIERHFRFEVTDSMVEAVERTLNGMPRATTRDLYDSLVREAHKKRD